MVRKTFLKYLFIIVALFLLDTIWAFADGSVFENKKSFLWEIKSKQGSGYLFGSIHFANESLYPLSKKIESSFSDSSALVVELNPLTLDMQKMEKMVAEKGMYKGDENIVKNINQDTLRLLSEYLLKKGIPAESILQMKPPLLALNLVTSQLMKMGYYPEFGIDMYFSKKANTHIPIYELETMEEQASMVFDLSNGEAFLKYTLLDLSTMEADFQDMVDAWKSGDSQKMEELIFGPFQKDPVLVTLFQRIFYLRNKSMVVKIKDLLQTNKKIFIVVGAGHLVGEKGIVQLLKDTGMSVKQL